MTKETLKQNIETIAAEKGKNEIEIITLMQTGAATTDNEELLNMLCELKWDYIEV